VELGRGADLAAHLISLTALWEGDDMNETVEPERPVVPPQILLTLAPDGVGVAVQIQGTTDRMQVSRMLAAAILSANQPEAQAPRPRIVLPGVRLNGVRG